MQFPSQVYPHFPRFCCEQEVLLGLFGRWLFLPMADELDLTIHFASAWCFLYLFFPDTIFTSAGWEHSCTPTCAIIPLSTHGLHFGSSLIPHQCRGFVFEGCNEQSGKEMQKGCRSPEFRPGDLGKFPFVQAPCDRSSTTLDLFASSSSCWPASCIVPSLVSPVNFAPIALSGWIWLHVLQL